ncbi:MAG: magnesium-dependent phosphatase-1 [Thermoprotei archaeon]
MIKAVVFDADKTLWDHHNISAFVEPLRLVGTDSVEDSAGNKLTLFPYVRETLKEIKNMGLLLGLATWNVPDKTEKVLKLLGLWDYFDIIVSKDFPYKFLHLTELILIARDRGIKIKPEEIAFFDDRRVHFGNVWLYLGDVKCYEMWKDVKSFQEVLAIVKSLAKEGRETLLY